MFVHDYKLKILFLAQGFQNSHFKLILAMNYQQVIIITTTIHFN